MKIKSIIRFSTLPALAILALVTGLGLAGCAETLSGVDSDQPVRSLSVEVAGIDFSAAGSRALMTDGAVETGTVVVSAYDSTTQLYLGTTGNMVRGVTTYTGSISPTATGTLRFRAYVKDSLGNFLYYGEATQVVTEVTTALAAPILVAARAPRATVNLQTDTSKGLPGSAGNYVILAEAGITTTGVTAITGNIAISPGAAAAITGFAKSMDVSGDFATDVAQILGGGKIYASDYVGPGDTPGNLTVAVTNMHTAYTDAAGRTVPNTEIGGAAVEFGNHLIVPGLYKFTGAVSVATGDVVLDGGPSDVWIFQIGGALAMGAARNVTLTGGALPQNVYWQVAGAVTFGAGAWMKGIVLADTSVDLTAGAKVTGRLLAKTAVTMSAPTVVAP